MKNRNIILTTILLALGSLALPQRTQAVVPAPDGGYPGQNTAEGQAALLHLAGGTYNTAVGWSSLGFNVTGNFNTAVGAATLLANTADANTAAGAGALLSNTTGSYNTANGVFALFGNTQGHDNAATGDYALYNNSSGSNNTAVGRVALYSNTTGSLNTAVGVLAGHDLTTGDNNIDIGNNVVGVAGESNTIRIGDADITDTFIRGISGSTVPNGVTVIVNGNGRLGTIVSSARFKDEIQPMNKASEAIFALKPVTFRYKKELDPVGVQQFGLVAEDVEKVNRDLVVRDDSGKVNSVRYEQVNAMLLNEFLKEHKTVEKLKADFQATVATQQKEIQILTTRLEQQAAQIQKVSAQIEINKARPAVVRNNLRRTESNTSPQ